MRTVDVIFLPKQQKLPDEEYGLDVSIIPQTPICCKYA